MIANYLWDCNGNNYDCMSPTRTSQNYFFYLSPLNYKSYSILYFSCTIISDPVINGGWSSWGSWSACSECNNGQQSRTRVCDSPPPSRTGKYCENDFIEWRDCSGNCNGEDTDSTLLNGNQTTGRVWTISPRPKDQISELCVHFCIPIHRGR